MMHTVFRIIFKMYQKINKLSVYEYLSIFTKCASRMSYLRENESSINYLHRELQAFTRLLSEAKTVVQETPYLLDVEEHLKKADVSLSEETQCNINKIAVTTIVKLVDCPL